MVDRVIRKDFRRATETPCRRCGWAVPPRDVFGTSLILRGVKVRRCAPVVIAHLLVLLVLVLLQGPALANAEEADDSTYASDDAQQGDGDEPLDWMEIAAGLGLFPLAGIVAVLLVANSLVIPDLCTRSLMKSYQDEGTVVDGTVLSCRPVPSAASNEGECRAQFRMWRPRGPSAKPLALLDEGDAVKEAATEAPSSSRCVAEIMYEAVEHKYMDNPSLKFRHPEMYETKRFVRTFELEIVEGDPGENPRMLQRGDRVPVLLLRGMNHTRSGCPQVVVEKIYNSFSLVKVTMVIVVAGVALGVLVTIALRNNSASQLENSRGGWAVLVVVLVGGECLGLLIAVDRFLKLKRRRFDNALPVVSSVEQRELQQAKRRVEQEESGRHGGGRDPFRIPLHEFAGHARASERHRFD